MTIRLYYFTAAWCSPCRKFGPVLINEAADRGLELVRVDLDNDTAGLAHAFSVMTVPTVVVLRSGEIVDRFGNLGPNALRDRLTALATTA